jgi:hypothetical protein
MWNKQIDGLIFNHSSTPLFEQKQMWTLKAKEIKSSSKIDLKDMLWWMSIKDACKLWTLVTVKLSKERCISIIMGKRLSWTAWRHDWKRCGPPSTWKTYSSKMCLLKIWNLEHIYRATKTQLHIKTNESQTSVDKKLIPPKDIRNQAWSFTKEP